MEQICWLVEASLVPISGRGTIEPLDLRLPFWLRKQFSDLLMQYLAHGAFERGASSLLR